MSKVELTIAGVGGQGSILAGVILGTAAVRFEQKYATQTQAYSSELRGGFAATWLIISDEPVVYPRVKSADIVVAQAQDSISRFAHTLNPDGKLIIDEDIVREIPGEIEHVYRIPATSLARNTLKAPITANIVILGALCRVSRVVGRHALEQAVAQMVPKGKEELNLKAFNLGFENVQGV
ncbi:MAG: 2-oxoacid:acceptor oxidoreductase family protein [Desulfohalobiaceae bacterium]|nr:2-oxoacid:acceptor oxidoreductase family protein [Desulfohalobiaceae bacterium]MCF8104285.1 2-oxoacid:acceptor oxidoreductase family protein [Desulfohalobiaceae bacterium]